MTTIRLGDLQEVPEKQEITYQEECIDLYLQEGFNQCKAEYDSLKLNLIKEEIYKIVSQIQQVGMIQEYSLGYEWCELVAQSISDNIGKILKVQPIERK